MRSGSAAALPPPIPNRIIVNGIIDMRHIAVSYYPAQLIVLCEAAEHTPSIVFPSAVSLQPSALANATSPPAIAMVHWTSRRRGGPPFFKERASSQTLLHVRHMNEQLSPQQQQQRRELLELLAQCSDHLGGGDDVDALVEGARAWLVQLKREASELQAMPKLTLQQKSRLTLSQLNVEHCECIISLHEALKQSSARCTLVIPPDGAVYRPNVKRDDQQPKNIMIRNARFFNGIAREGMRFEVPVKPHVVLSDVFECSAVHPDCELAAVDDGDHPPAFVTVVSVTKSAQQDTAAGAGSSDGGSFDVVVSAVPHVRLLPPPEAFRANVSNGKTVEMMSRKNFQSWQRMEMIEADRRFSAAPGGWSEDDFSKWLDAAQAER